MTTLELREPELTPLTLAAQQRVMLGGKGASAGLLEERIAIGRPICQALDLATVDAEARTFLEGRPGSSFWLLGLTCSFIPDKGEPMETAWLKVEMTTVSPDGGTEPVAWSMEPLSLSDPVQMGKTVGLDASLKLTSPVVPIDIGPTASLGTSKEWAKRVPFVEAHREGTATPSWIFSRTLATEIRGVHRLRAVVELPAGGVGEAVVSVGAKVKMKMLGLVPYRADLDELPEHETVTLGAR